MNAFKKTVKSWKNGVEILIKNNNEQYLNVKFRFVLFMLFSDPVWKYDDK